mgnify:CR=1 FL=1
MTERVHIRPLRGLKVPNPSRGGRHLADGGERVGLSSYWHRRLRAGEVERIPAQNTAKKAEKKEG